MSIAATSSTGYSAPVIRGTRGRMVPTNRVVEIYDDFALGTTIAESAVMPSVGTTRWVTHLTEDGGGQGTIVLSNTAGGSLLFTTDAGAADETCLTSNTEFIAATYAGRAMAFETRFQVSSDANDDGNIFAGVGELHATANIGANNGTILGLSHVGFSIINSAITFSHGDDDSVTTSATLATLADATNTVLGWQYDPGSRNFMAYIDGARVLTTPLVAANDADDQMGILLGIGNGGGTTVLTLTADYIYFRGEM